MKAITLIPLLVLLTSCTTQQYEAFKAEQKKAGEYCDKAKASLNSVQANKAEICGPLMMAADLAPALAKSKEACSNDTAAKEAESAMLSACAITQAIQLP